MHTPRLALLLAAASLLSACNLGFDPTQYTAVSPGEETPDAGGDNNINNVNNVPDEDAGNNVDLPRGCEDRDEDGFGRGLDCPKDQIDCDDERAFVYPNAPEVCDGVDNNCNDQVDEGEDGNPLRMDCYTGDPAELGRPATACKRGFLTCVGGQFPEVSASSCTGQVLPRSFGEDSGLAVCDGLDNDCNGDVDPSCACPFEGDTRSCYDAGPAEKGGIGQCAAGSQRCVRDGDLLQWGSCLGSVAPGVEACDNPGVDNDCNGVLDDVPDLGSDCQTTEPGRCRMGRTSCVDDVLVCARVLAPIDETCNALDDDCDGVQDNGVSNVCGGCGAVPGTPGGACGACGDGLWTCGAGLTLDCVGARALNACNGCMDLPNPVGSGCGTCGVYACDGTDSVECLEGTTNICGGCGPVVEEGRLGQSCGQCGRWACDPEDPNALRCDDPGLNACGACGALPSSPGDTCGPCNDGRYACASGGTSLVCNGASAQNSCGGCNLIFNEPGDSCGAACGRYSCSEDNPGYLQCDEAPRNSCGGCAPLTGVPTESCGTCGAWACSGQNAVVCNDPGLNACGGCAPLAGAPGAACGQCGTWSCDGQNAVVCNDPGLNACNGCGDLGGNVPGGSCGQCGAWACSLDRTRLNCSNDQGFNACGGCGTITGALPGSACGQCGSAVCSSGNATACDDPGLNSCLGCGVLADAPGSACDDCGYYGCQGASATTCDMRECPSAPAALRVYNLILHNKNCTLDGDCGPGELCIPAANGVGAKDTCAPDWSIRVDPDLLFPYVPFTFSQNTSFFSAQTRFEATSVSAWRRDQDIELDPPKITTPIALSEGEEAMIVLANQRKACTTATAAVDCAGLPGSTCTSLVCRKTCTVEADCPGGACVQGVCTIYEAHVFPEDNTPVADKVQVRLLHFQPNHAKMRLRLKRPGSSTVVHTFPVVDYGDATPFAEIVPGVYDMEIQNEFGATIVTHPSRTLLGGEVYSFLSFGRLGSNTYWYGGGLNTRALDVLPIE